MKIDIEPVLEPASEFFKTVLKAREIPFLYVFRLANGTNYSIEFTKKELESFLPKKSVSEMLKERQESLQRDYDMYKSAVETGIHPYFKSRREIMHPILPNVGTGKFEDCDYILSKSEIKVFERLVERAEKKLGELTFVKIYL